MYNSTNRIINNAMHLIWVVMGMILGALSFSGCATILKEPYQRVEVVGAKQGMVLSTRFRRFQLKGPKDVVYLNRSVDDISARLSCSQSSHAQQIWIKTRPSRWYVAGNLLFFYPLAIGYLIDYMTAQGWNIDSPIQVGHYCQPADS